MSKQSDELAQIADHLDSDAVSINDIDNMILRLRKLSKWFKGLDDTALFLKRKTDQLQKENDKLRAELGENMKGFDICRNEFRAMVHHKDMEYNRVFNKCENLEVSIAKLKQEYAELMEVHLDTGVPLPKKHSDKLYFSEPSMRRFIE